MLTPKQKELLMFIHERVQESGISPSFDEMRKALNLRSKSGIHRLITALEERGFIRRLAHRARALEVIKLPESVPQMIGERRAQGFSPSVIEGSLGKELSAPNESPILSVPVMGQIAAGVPVSAIQNHSHDIDVPPQLLAKGEHFALEVEGDSMIDVGILDGDTVIICRCDVAENGDIVVALVDREEATLKRLRKRGQSVALEAANSDYKTQIFGPDRVQVQGRIVGLIRSYQSHF